MSSQDSKESFIIDSIDDAVSDRFAKSRPSSKLSKVDRFILAMGEVAPLVEEAMATGGDADSQKRRLIDLLTAQTTLADQLSENWGVDQDEILGSSNRHLLGRALSELVVTSREDLSDESTVLDLCGLVDDVVTGHPFIRKLAMDSGALTADDILVTLRLSSFPGIVKASNFLNGIDLSNEEYRRHLNSIFTATIALSRDVAYNYDPAGTLWDRERLFVSALPYCLTFCHEAWIDLAMEEISEDIDNTDIDVVVSKLPLTIAAINEMDMGYDDINNSRKSLYERLVQGADEYIHVEAMADIPVRLSRKLTAYRLGVIDEALSVSWVKASEHLMDSFERMTEEEQEHFMETEGKNPMNLAAFWGFFRSEMLATEKLVPEWSFESTDVLDAASNRLIALWGLSDSICKIRQVNSA